jgi:hypothetical protein
VDPENREIENVFATRILRKASSSRRLDFSRPKYASMCSLQMYRYVIPMIPLEGYRQYPEIEYIRAYHRAAMRKRSNLRREKLASLVEERITRAMYISFLDDVFHPVWRAFPCTLLHQYPSFINYMST